MDTTITSLQVHQGNYSSQQTQRASQLSSVALEKIREGIGQFAEDIHQACRAIDQLKKEEEGLSEPNRQQALEVAIQKIKNALLFGDSLTPNANKALFALCELKETAHLQDDMQRVYENRQFCLDSLGDLLESMQKTIDQMKDIYGNRWEAQVSLLESQLEGGITKADSIFLAAACLSPTDVNLSQQMGFLIVKDKIFCFMDEKFEHRIHLCAAPELFVPRSFASLKEQLERLGFEIETPSSKALCAAALLKKANVVLNDGGSWGVREVYPAQIFAELARRTNEVEEIVSLLGPFHLGGLKELGLSGWYQVTDEWLQAFAQVCPLLTNLTLHSCGQVTDNGLKALAAGCPGLANLCLSRCSQITDKGFEALATHCPGLTNLNLMSCRQISDRVLEVLAAHCRELSRLDLPGCSEITDRGLEALAAGCHELSSLDLSNTQITDNSLKALAAGCPSLTSLNLSNCGQITASGLQALATHCSGLTYLNLGGCGKITGKRSRQEMKIQFPNLMC